MDIQDLISGLDADQLKELKVALGLRKPPRQPKEQSPEFLAAKAELDGIVAENPSLIERYESAKAALKGFRVRQVLATERYTLDKDTGTVSKNGDTVCVFGDDGWTSAMRSAGFTTGQVAAVSKAMRNANATA